MNELNKSEILELLDDEIQSIKDKFDQLNDYYKELDSESVAEIVEALKSINHVLDVTIFRRSRL